MKIRTQLALAFVGLSVLPLSGLVLYSYSTSTRAMREALAADAEASTREMKARLDGIERDLRRGVAELGARSAGRPGGGADEGRRTLEALGAVLPFFRRIDYVPGPDEAGPGARTGRRNREGSAEADAARVIEGIRRALPDARETAEKAKGKADGARIAAEVTRALLAGAEEAAREAAREAPPPPPAAPPPPGRVELPIDLPGAGRIQAQVSSRELLDRVCDQTRQEAGEIPFVLDRDGRLHTLDRKSAARLAGLGLPGALAGASGVQRDDWLVITSKDEGSGLAFGLARPVGEPLRRVRQAAVSNFGWGLGLIGLALLGILPLSRRMTRSVHAVTEGADRIAQGDLSTRVPVLAGNELGQLAAAFNHMAEVLAEQRGRLIEGERQRRDAELQQRLLENGYARKTAELEEARQFQLSLLPRTLPDHPRYAVAASMTTATEVGGDYYDFRLSDDGTLTAAIGDATGHGVKAGTLVTVVKSLFSAYADVAPLSTFLAEASEVIQRMGLDRMLMSVALARFEGAGMTIAAAGMPPVLVYRGGDGAVEEYLLPGMPLGGLACDYRELRVPLAAGDAVLLMSDGLPESPGEGDDPLGYGRVTEIFAGLGARTAEEIVAGLNAAAEERAGAEGLADDVTFVVLKVRG